MATTRTYVKSNKTRAPLIMLSCPVTSARTMASVSAAAAAAATSDYTVGYYVPSMSYYDIPALTAAPAAAPAATSSGTPSASSVEE